MAANTMNKFKLILVIVLAVGVIAVLSVAAHWLLQQNSIGIDFYNHYVAGRALFITKSSPYLPEVTQAIQLGIYQRLAKPGEDQFAFVYPPYHLLLLLPFFFLSFDWAQAIWLAINIVLITSGVLIAIPRPPKWLLFSVLFFYPFSFGLIMGSIAVFLGFLVLLFYKYLLNPTSPSPALQLLLGALLAWATCKPQFMWLYAILFVIASLKYKLWSFLSSLLFSFAALVAISFWLVPGWIPQITNNIITYSQNNHSWPTLTSFLLPWFAQKTALILSGIVFLVLLIITAGLVFSWWHERILSLPLFAWVGLTTYLIHPNSAPYEQIAMVLPVIVWAGSAAAWNTKKALYWFGGIIFYWLIFLLGRLPEPIQTVHDWSVFYYLPWVIVVVSQARRSTLAVPVFKCQDESIF